MGFLKTEAPSE